MNPNVSSGNSPQQSLLQQLTNTAYNKQIENAWRRKDEPNNQGRAALPHLIILANQKSGSHSRLTAARWLCRNHYGLPAAIVALIELAFEPHEQLSFDALSELHRIDDPQAVKGVEGIAKWGPHKELRLRAGQLLCRKTAAQELWETASQPAHDFVPLPESIRPPIVSELENEMVLSADPADPVEAQIDEGPQLEKVLQDVLQLIDMNNTTFTLPLPAIKNLDNKGSPPPPPTSPPDTKARPQSSPTQEADEPPQISSHIDLLRQLLLHNDQQPLWLPSLLLVLTIIAELFFLLPNTLLGSSVYIGVLFLLLYNVMYVVEAPVRRLNTLLIVLPLIRLLSLGATYYLATYIQTYQ